ncbi:MAG: hypothetical protein Q4A00_04400 [Flavobacteriaceae bacterium]|nr:hypothetical protein [Flavobacteriaceae bacterium]
MSVFLFSNYAVNITHHHHDEIDITKKNAENKEQNCFICHFQGLLYEPLVQQDFAISHLQEEGIVFIRKSNSLFVLSEFFRSVWLRGPPVYFP